MTASSPGPLFDRIEQAENIERVSRKIGATVLAFCRQRLASNPTFAITDLYDAVHAVHRDIAPGSPDRILRQLRRTGSVAYEVINRASSLYRLTEVAS